VSEPTILPFAGIWPTIADDAWIAPGAVIVGDVRIGPGASVWYNAVVRGDVAPVTIGRGSNVQDNAVLHVDSGQPCVLGEDVTVGHGAIVHGTTVGDGTLIGMGAIVLSRSLVGPGCIVAAGAVVPEDAVVAPGMLVMGVPAKPKRPLDAGELERALDNARRYVTNAARHRASREVGEASRWPST
jgi:carbonic anhydrase/acetyltransferase-like protein (isoleucine patch superfamily)